VRLLQAALGPGAPAHPGKALTEPLGDSLLGPSAAGEPGGGAPPLFGRFQLLRELGRGGCGVVFLAFDPVLGRKVALKVPRPEALLAPELRQRFVREARAGAALDHPNLVPVYEAGEVGSICYIATAYCPGPTLAEWLKTHAGPVPPRRAARLVATLADAVHAIHQHGIWHRDLKPGNILLTESGDLPAEAGAAEASLPPDDDGPLFCGRFTPRITDFGLAKLLDGGGEETRTGVVLGTPAYMAPEQAQGRPDAFGPAADVYALGVILYELLVGRRPFQGDSQTGLLRRVAHEEPVPPRRSCPGLPRDLEAVCLKCLEKEPQRRYPSAEELAGDLRRFLAGQPTQARPLTGWQRAGRWIRR
jgi:serine/threonine protein kinase